MEFISRIKELINSAETYAELKLKELKLELAEKVSSTFADAMAGIIVVIFVLISIIFISLWGALFLNKVLASSHLGFLIIGLFWLVLGFTIFATRNMLIKKPVKNWIVQKVMTNK